MRMRSTAAGEPPRSPGQAGAAATRAGKPLAGAGATVERWARPLRVQAGRLPGLARQHWLLTALLSAGLVLRVLTQIAYRPALLFIDSTKYLLGAYPGDDPPGYKLALKPLLLVGNLDLVAALQHLLGLAMAITLYTVLLRRGAPRWLAALATAPLLLDAYQLQIEQTIMPDVMFETLIVAGLAALLWRPRPTTALVITGGLALGASATARQVGEIFLLPALAYTLLATTTWRHRARNTALLTAAFAIPILFASYQNYLSIHRFSLAPYASGSIFGRMAESANCATLKMPAYERPLCPTAQQKRLGPDGLDHDAGSPLKTFVAPYPHHASAVVRDFNRRVLRQQPGNVLAGIGQDALKLFEVDRVDRPGDTPIARWQFQRAYPVYRPYVDIQQGKLIFGTYNKQGVELTIGTAARFGAAGPTVVSPLASFLRSYQLGGGYTPGPLLALTAIAGLAGSLAVLRRRRRGSTVPDAGPGQAGMPASQQAAQACLLFFTAAVTVLLASDVFEFSWRYQLPALITLPPAAAMAVTVLLARRRAPGPRPADVGEGAAAGPPAAAAGGDGTRPRDRARAS